MQIQFIILGYISLFILGLADNMRGPLFPDILKDLKLNDTKGGLFFSISALLSVLGSVLVRTSYNRFGAIRSLRIALCLIVIGFAGIFFITSLNQLLILSSITGIGFGAVSFLENIFITIGVGKETKYLRQIFSGLHSMYGLSSFIAPLIVALLYTLHLQWKIIFLFSTIPPLLFLFYLLAISANYKRSEQKKVSKIIDTRYSADHLQQILFSIFLSCYVVGEVLISSRLALYMQRIYHSSAVVASTYVMFFFIALFLGRLLFAIVPFKLKSSSLMQFSLASASLFIVLGLLLHPWMLALSAFFMGPFFPTAMTYAVETFPTKSESAISWAVTMFSIAIVFMHFFTGVVTDTFGIVAAFAMPPLWFACAFALLFLQISLLDRKKN